MADCRPGLRPIRPSTVTQTAHAVFRRSLARSAMNCESLQTGLDYGQSYFDMSNYWNDELSAKQLGIRRPVKSNRMKAWIGTEEQRDMK